jgi:predicted transcriptional regulator
MSMDEVFVVLKLNSREKKVLHYLMKHKQGTSFEIQKETAMQQPWVSMATKTLQKRGYLQSELIPRTTKPRKQIQTYRLTKDGYKLMLKDLIIKTNELNERCNAYTRLMEEFLAMIKSDTKENVTT